MTYTRWAPCQSCCGFPCITCQDAFTRADTSPGDPLDGCGYATTGSWQISSNTLLGHGSIEFQYRTDGELDGGFALSFIPTTTDIVDMYIGDTTGSGWYKFRIIISHRLSQGFSGGVVTALSLSDVADVTAYSASGRILGAQTFPVVSGTEITFYLSTADMYIDPTFNSLAFNDYLGPASAGHASDHIKQGSRRIVFGIQPNTISDPPLQVQGLDLIIFNGPARYAPIVFNDIAGITAAYGMFATSSSKAFKQLVLLRNTSQTDLDNDLETATNPSCGILDAKCVNATTNPVILINSSAKVAVTAGSPVLSAGSVTAPIGTGGAVTVNIDNCQYVISAVGDTIELEHQINDFVDQYQIGIGLTEFIPICSYPDARAFRPTLDGTMCNEVKINLANGYWVLINSGVRVDGLNNTKLWVAPKVQIGQGSSVLADANITLADIGYKFGLGPGFIGTSIADNLPVIICYNNGVLTVGPNDTNGVFLTPVVWLSIVTGASTTTSTTKVNLRANQLAAPIPSDEHAGGGSADFFTPNIWGASFRQILQMTDFNDPFALSLPEVCIKCPQEIGLGTGPTSLTFDFLVSAFISGGNTYCDTPGIIGGAYVMYRTSNNNQFWGYTQPPSISGSCGFSIVVQIAIPGATVSTFDFDVFATYTHKILAWVSFYTSIGSIAPFAIYGSDPVDDVAGTWSSQSLSLLHQDASNFPDYTGFFPSSIVIHL